MRQSFRILFVLSVFVFVAGSSSKAQYMFDRTTRFLLGVNVLTPMSDDKNFASLGPSAVMRYPSLSWEYDVMIAETEKLGFWLSSGAGFFPRGFKYKYDTDSVYRYKLTSYGGMIGTGITFFTLVSSDGAHPISFYAYGFLRLPLYHKYAWNDRLSDVEFGLDFINEYLSYGLATRLHFTLYEGAVIGLNVFHGMEIPMKKFTYYKNNPTGVPEAVVYRNITNCFGIAMNIYY